MSAALGRRATAEAVGTALLVCAVVGSGIAAQRLSPHDLGLQLLENSIATGAALVALILALQPVSAAFNPVVTLVEVVLDGLPALQAGVLIAAQVVGGAIGTVVANLMFGLHAATLSTHHRASGPHLLGEVVATFGLVLVIFACLRHGAGDHTGHGDRVGYAVAGYVTAAYWFTSSTSFANPAVTFGRMLTDTFAGIAPSSVPAFVGVQLLGGVLALALVRFLYPTASQGATA